MDPVLRPLHVALNDCALSSTTGIPCFSAMANMGSMSAERPNRCTTTIAFVRGVMRASSWSGSS